MLDQSLDAEFRNYRSTLSTEMAKRAFNERIERLVNQHGVDYVRGYVHALQDASLLPELLPIRLVDPMEVRISACFQVFIDARSGWRRGLLH
jgi:hypothetical protein